MSLRLAVVTLLLFLMSSAPAPARGAEGETEARIAARVLADGRIEMALQQREAGEAWGALLPAGVRFLRPFAETGRWLVSVPVGLAAEGSDRGPSGAASARIHTRFASPRAASTTVASSSHSISAGRGECGVNDRSLVRDSSPPGWASAAGW